MTSALRLLLAFLLCLGAAGVAAAQGAVPVLQGQTLDGRAYDLAQRRGRVVMVVLWRTDCAVCLSKMPELRANAAGWQSAPFDLVLVNLDREATDAGYYDRLRLALTGPAAQTFSLWQGQARLPAEWRAPPRLPLTLVIDREGRLAARHEGRVPPEVWNAVADLLP